MKTILAILCALVVLFAGGCALVLLFSGLTSGGLVFALIPGAIAVLNVMVLMALYGKGKPQRQPFYILGVLDLIGAGFAAMFWSSISYQVNDIWTLAVPVMAILLLKAVLTFLVARKLPQGGNPPQG